MIWTYGVLQPGPGKITICLCSMSTKEIEVDTNMAVSEIMAANAIPIMLAPKPKEDEKIYIQVKQNLVEIDNIHEMAAKCLDKIDTSGLQDCCPEEQ